MEITLNVNINAPALVELMKEALAAAGKPVNNTKPGTPANDTRGVAAAPSAAEDSAETKKPAGKTRNKTDAAAPPSVAATATPAAALPDGLTREVVKARLSDYSGDKRYGMEGVFKILAKYGVQRISELPEASFVAFKQEIDEALAAPKPDPMA